MSNQIATNSPTRPNAAIGAFSVLATVALIVYVIAQLAQSIRVESATILERVWSTDIEQLGAKQKLPSYWAAIRQVEKIPGDGDNTALQWTKTVSVPIEINPAGEYKLEVLFISQTSDSGVPQAVIQHHIVHIPSGNSVWEFGRTYDLTDHE